MDSFLDFKDAEATLAQLAEQLAEEKIPVQHATDGVAKVLGTKSAVKFLTHLRPGAEKHTSWDKVNTALTKQGVKTHHIAKIASHIKPAQYKEEVDLGEEKDIVIRDKSGKVTKWSHEGDWSKSVSSTTTDKSGAKHTPYSKARDLARSALKKTLTKEEIEQIDELKKSTLASYAKKSAAELPKHQMNATYKAVGPIAAAHAGKHPKTGESPIEWDNRKVKNRGAGVARAVDKLAKEETDLQEAGAYQKDMDEKKPVYAQGVKGMKSKPFTKKFKSMDHYNKWADSEHSSDHEVHRVYQESTDTCSACGQTPCNCTHINEEVHRVGVTVSDPNHTMVSQRKEKVQKFVRIKGGSHADAVERAKKHFKSKGWKVHDAEHAGMVHEEVELEEAKTPAEKMDFQRMMAGAMSRDEYNKKYKKGKYAQKSGKYKVDPSGIYHNLIKTAVKEESQIDELSNATLQSYKDKAMKSADELAAKGQHSKANDRYMKHMQASGKQISRTMQNIHKAMQQRQQNEDIELEEAMDKDSLRKALAKHEQHAIDANRRGDDEAVKMHQGKMNQIKDKMAKLARSA